MKEIAAELKKGNFKKASELGAELVKSDASTRGEIMEIVRQAMIVNLKQGKVSVAKEINKYFLLPQDMLDETVQQAVVSSLYEGDIEHVRGLKRDLPIRRELGQKIVGYCSGWGRRNREVALKELFT